MRIDVHAHYYPPEFTKAYGRETTISRNALTAPGGRATIDERVDMLPTGLAGLALLGAAGAAVAVRRRRKMES